ncbi:MAG: ABC transporter ATP-binding protein [Ferrimicrobium sp.]
MARVELQGIEKRYGADVVVDNIDLTVHEGEFLVLLGPSGCGKTTVLRMVAGLESITAGTLHFDDAIMNNIPPGQRNVGMVFQNYALYPHMTVFDNLSFGLRSLRSSSSRREARGQIQKRVHEIAQLLEIDHVLDHRPKQLSGGQRQRVALGRALIREPAVFLMDEPLSNLDANLRDRVRIELGRLHEQFPVSTVYVTHDQGEALTLADRIIIMKDGSIRQTGTPDELYRYPVDTFVAHFIGAPGMNLWNLNLTTTSDSVSAGPGFTLHSNFGSIIASAGPNVVVGIRPEHLHVVHEISHPGATLKLHVTAVERFGSHLLVHGSLLGTESSVVARLDTDLDVHRGDTIELAAALDQISLFDANSNERIPGLDQLVSRAS